MYNCVRCGTETSLHVNGQPLCVACDSGPNTVQASRPAGLPRHQCLIYDGSPSKHLNGLAILIATNLRADLRCLYFDSPPMVAGLRSRLAATGLHVAAEVAKGSLVLSSDQDHLVGGRFDSGRMLRSLAESVEDALAAGYRGLWATGDMTWELGQNADFRELIGYEYGLEELFRRTPHLSGICQYHRETLPAESIQDALCTHPAIYINDTLSRMNPFYEPRQAATLRRQPASRSHIEAMLKSLQLAD